ncbi:MAG: GFA family protein [Cyanophyceae cyanobacterium]
MWNAEAADFRLLTGAAELADYGKSGDWGEGHHRFCRRCGIATHSHGRIDAMGGDFLSVHLAALDDLPVNQLVAAPVDFQDGLHDDWQHEPKERRHL